MAYDPSGRKLKAADILGKSGAVLACPEGRRRTSTAPPERIIQLSGIGLQTEQNGKERRNDNSSADEIEHHSHFPLVTRQ
jgi:hypothetical protein